MVEEQLISEFNEAKFQILRLHNLWTESKQYRTSGDLKNCRWVLDSAEVELEVDIEKLDENKDNNYREQLDKIEKNLEQSKKHLQVGKFYTCLIEKEKLLRKIQNEAGKGGRYKNPSDDEMM